MSVVGSLGRRSLLAGVTALAGCSVLQRPTYVERTQWPLAVTPARSLPPRRHGKVLLVQDFQAAPGLDEQGVQWLEADGSVHVDFYNTWLVTPARAITDDLRRWLGASGLFAAVVGPNSGLTPDLLLEGEVTAFRADPRRLLGHAALSLMVLGQRAGSFSRVLLQTVVSADARMPSDTPSGVVAAQREALIEVLQRTQAALAPLAVR